MLLFLGARAFWFSVVISWCALSLWLTWRHRPATFPLPEPFPLMVSVVATSPLGVPLGWWLMRRDELPTVASRVWRARAWAPWCTWSVD